MYRGTAKPETAGGAVPLFFLFPWEVTNCPETCFQPDSSAGNHTGIGVVPNEEISGIDRRGECGKSAFVYTKALLRQFVINDFPDILAA